MVDLMTENSLLHTRLAAAYIRGKLRDAAVLPPALVDAPLESLDDRQLAKLLDVGRANRLRLHRFKHTMGLQRVAKVLGVLKGIGPVELLDIGSERGAFLWPLLDAFPWLPITALDTLDYRVADIRAMHEGRRSTARIAASALTCRAGCDCRAAGMC
jgi:hypothetical protein